jgi:hypothetical protein
LRLIVVPKKTKAGDVFEVTLRDGKLAYLQKIGDDAIGDFARVLDGRYDSPARDLQVLASGRHEYLIYTYLAGLVSDGMARSVGNWPVPDGAWSGLKLSPRYGKTGQLEAWIVTDGRIARDRLESLPADLRKALPIWQLGDSLHAIDILSASRIGGLDKTELRAWRHDHGISSQGVPEHGSHEEPAEEPGVNHFALFPAKSKLDRVIAALKQAGFTSSVFTDPHLDGQLLIVRAGPTAPGFIDEQSDLVRDVVGSQGGDYDGWEATTGGTRQPGGVSD